MMWDDRTSLQAAIDTGKPDHELTRILAERSGSVLWLGGPNGGYSTWTLAGRSNWVSATQGASVVFSRPLSIEWDRRVRQLIDLGLAGAKLRAPYSTPVTDPTPDVSHAALMPLCRGHDAPAWVISSIDNVQPDSGTLEAQTWQSPAPAINLSVDNNHVSWKRSQHYAIFDCSSHH
jgi:hypothetical protein